MSYLDTRDLVERETEIEGEIEELEEAAHGADSVPAEDHLRRINGELESLRHEAQQIANLRDEIGSEFDHGETMIPTHEFEQYAEEFAKDIGAISDDDQWPLGCIDWKEAAEQLAADYVEVEWDGTDYYVRSS
jgi:hypothetical protein